MNKSEKTSRYRREEIDRSRPARRDERDSSSDRIHAFEEDPSLATDTGVRPSIDKLVSLLARAQSDERRANTVLRLQQTYGNAYVQRLLTEIGAQAKLTISNPDDTYEREANRVAEGAVKALDTTVQRQEEQEEEEEELQMKPASVLQRQEEEELEEVQMKPASELQRQDEQPMTGAGEDGTVQLSEALEARIEKARTGGESLPDATRAALEPILGYDFGGVRVHTDTEADELSRQLEALAFTTGSDIFFRKGAYEPESMTGKGLLAHELTHVAQQRAAPMVQRTNGGTATAAEGEAAPAETATTAPATSALRALWDTMVIGSAQQAYEALTGSGRLRARAGRAAELLSRAEDTIRTIRPSYEDNADTFGRLNWAHSRLETIRIGLQAYSGERWSIDSITAVLEPSGDSMSILGDIRERL
ncbi:MAG: DUF4157 domain-containing protein [Dehalococcoidia bacterium]